MFFNTLVEMIRHSLSKSIIPCICRKIINLEDILIQISLRNYHSLTNTIYSLLLLQHFNKCVYGLENIEIVKKNLSQINGFSI